MFKNKVWKTVPIAEMNDYYNFLKAQDVNFQRKGLSLLWSFKIKRNADGSLSKYIARIFCHGCRQELGINYWKTYAPVVNWTSVRAMLILSKLHSLISKSIGFSLAYSQANVKTQIYLHPPQGVELSRGNRNVVLKLCKNLY